MLNSSFNATNISDVIHQNFFELCLEVCKREIPSNSATGIVIAGFGKKEYFPALNTYTIDGKYNKFLRVWPDLTKTRNLNNNQHRASIIPFAQSDMIYLFLQGITSENLGFIMPFLKDTLSVIPKAIISNYIKDSKKQALAEKEIEEIADKVTAKFFDDFKTFRKEKFIDQILSVVYNLPKEEMAVMAEALVELTTLRRKVDSTLQSVGGPTDVALISKGDGFVWIKRKHYFDIQLNPDFMKRKAATEGEITNEV